MKSTSNSRFCTMQQGPRALVEEVRVWESATCRANKPPIIDHRVPASGAERVLAREFQFCSSGMHERSAFVLK